jgi:hypothetical protein
LGHNNRQLRLDEAKHRVTGGGVTLTTTGLMALTEDRSKHSQAVTVSI